MKRIILLVAAITVAVVGIAPAANASRAAPAVETIATVVPSGCHTAWDANTSTYIISTGQTVTVGAIHTWSEANGIVWSSSGASAGLDLAFTQPNDTKAYQISVHRWESGSTHYNGPSAVIQKRTGVLPLTWDPNPPLWLTNNAVLYEVAGYDVNRPSVGFDFFQPACG